MLREEIDQHFGVKCMHLMLESRDTDEIAKLTAMRLGLYEGAADAPKQTAMEI